MQTKEIKILVFEFESIGEMDEPSRNLVLRAREAAENAYAPYSGFKVGCALLLSTGEIILGNNQENSAYPSGLCAERVALFYANANYPGSSVKTMAVTAISKRGLPEEPVRPCGACRQAILETEIRFKQPIKIILDGKNKIQVLEGVDSLLPLSFSSASLL